MRCLVLRRAAPCPVHACVHASGMLRACSVLRAPSMGTYGILWEVMGIFCVFLRCKAFFHNVFYTAGRFLLCILCCRVFFSQRFFAIGCVYIACFRCKSFFTTFFTLQDVFRCVFCAMSRFCVVHFVLCRVFASCFDTFSEPQPTFSEPQPTFPEPRPTLPEPRTTLLVPMHTFPEPQYVPVCRMYVTAFVNMLLLYV